MFTTRHYVAIARTIHNQWEDATANGRTHTELRRMIAALGDMFAQDNPRFSYARFRMACMEG